MHGQGNFFDPRLDDATQYPVAAKNKSGHTVSDNDRVTGKLNGLQAYQLSLAERASGVNSSYRDAQTQMLATNLQSSSAAFKFLFFH